MARILILFIVQAFTGKPATMPSADFCAAITGLTSPLSPGLPDTTQTSRGKIDRLHCTPAGFTTPALDGCGLRDLWLARPTGQASYPVLSIGSRLCSALPSDSASRRRPCASLILRRHQAGLRTRTSKLTITLGTPKKAVPGSGTGSVACNVSYVVFGCKNLSDACPGGVARQ